MAAVATTQDRIEITRNGEPAATLVSQQELDALRKTIAIVSDPDARRDLEEAEADIAGGRTVRSETMREAMLSRRPASA